MTKTLTLTFRGKPLDLTPPPKPSLLSIYAYLDKLKLGDLVEREDILRHCNIAEGTFGGYIKLLLDYTFKPRKNPYYGNKKTIAAARKQYAEAE